MNYDAAKSEMTALRNLGGKIGIAGLATPDFDLVYANAQAVEKYCDRFESIGLIVTRILSSITKIPLERQQQQDWLDLPCNILT